MKKIDETKDELEEKEKILKMIHKFREDNREAFAEDMCLATLRLLISCYIGKIATKDKNIFFRLDSTGKTYVLSMRRMTEEDFVPDKFE